MAKVMQQDLVAWFNRANLKLVLEQKPLITRQGAVNSGDIFQMSIAGDRYFRAFTGNSGNIVRVIDADPSRRQVVLLVKEPSRDYVFTTNTVQFVDGRPRRVVRRHHERTSAETRKYLCGHDEIHLFIAELPRRGAINSVGDAHRALRPEPVANAATKRQGEWFFVPATSAELAEIAEAINAGGFLKTAERIDPAHRGKPHVADEVVRLRSISPGSDQTRAFVRGRIRHPDHHTARLRVWCRAVHNAEATRRGTSGIASTHVVGWID